MVTKTAVEIKNDHNNMPHHTHPSVLKDQSDKKQLLELDAQN